MIHKPLPCKGLSIRIPIIIPIKGRGFSNHGSTLGIIGFKELTGIMGFIDLFGGYCAHKSHRGYGLSRVSGCRGSGLRP